MVLLTDYPAIQRYLADDGEGDMRWSEVRAVRRSDLAVKRVRRRTGQGSGDGNGVEEGTVGEGTRLGAEVGGWRKIARGARMRNKSVNRCRGDGVGATSAGPRCAPRSGAELIDSGARRGGRVRERANPLASVS